MSRAIVTGAAIAMLIGVFIAAIMGISQVAKSDPNPTPLTEVRGIVTLDDNKGGSGPVSDLEISNAIGNVAADCKGRVMVDRGNYLVTVYCSPLGK